MKTNMYLLVACVATLLLGACTRELIVTTDHPSEPSEEYLGDANVVLTIGGTQSANSRSVGADANADYPTQAVENTVNRLTIGVFYEQAAGDNDGGKTNAIIEAEIKTSDNETDITNKVIPELKVITGADNKTKYATQFICNAAENATIIAVANAPAKTFAKVKSLKEFKARTLALKNISKDVTQKGFVVEDKIVTNQLPMSGELTEIDLKSGNEVNKPANALELSRLVARVSIDKLKVDFDTRGQYADATFKPTKVFLYNAMEYVTVGVGDTVTTTPKREVTNQEGVKKLISAATFVHGGKMIEVDDPDNPGQKILEWEKGDIIEILDDITETVSWVDGDTDLLTRKYWYYAFPNGDRKKRTKLVIAGIFDPDGPDANPDNTTPHPGSEPEELVFYPIIVNKNQPGTTITNVDNSTPPNTTTPANLTGSIARNTLYKLSATIKGKGVDDPAKDIDPVDLELTVEVANWVLTVNQDVTFN